jgi:hypothetical protein
MLAAPSEVAVESELEVNGLCDVPKAKPAAHHSTILSDWLDLPVPNTVFFAPIPTFAKFILEARVSKILTGEAVAIDGEWCGLSASLIDKASFETGGCGGVLYRTDQMLAVGLLTGNLMISHWRTSLVFEVFIR